MARLTLRRLPRRGERRVDIPALLWRGRWFAVAVLAAALVFYGILWFLFVSAGARTGEYLEKALDGRVKLERIKVTREFRVDVYGIRVYAPDDDLMSGDVLLEASRVSVWPEWSALLFGRMKARRVEIWDPRLEVRALPGGGTSVDHWMKRASDESGADAARAFPALVEIHGGSVLAQLTTGQRERHAYLLIENISGRAGRVRGGHIAMDLKAAVFGSEFTLQGAVAPGKDDDTLSLEVEAPFFAFAELADLARLCTGSDLHKAADLPLGTGRLHARIAGTPHAPRIQGKAALRDFDADFVIENDRLDLSQIRAGAGDHKINGSATLDFADQDLPYLLELDFKGVPLADMLSPAMGFQYAPEGAAGGMLRISGALARHDPPEVGGRLEVRGGKLRFPLLFIGPGPFPFGNTASLPFDRLTADFSTDRDSVTLENVHIAGPGYAMGGSARAGTAPSGLDGFAEPFPYSLDLEITAEDLGAALDNVRAWQGMASGSLKGSLHIEGDLGLEGSARGTARFTLTSGMAYNPYYIPGRARAGVSAEVTFDRLTSHLRLENRVLYVSGTLSDNGLEMKWDGRADTEDGSILFTGDVDASTDAARRFQGLAPYVMAEEADTFTNYKAHVRVEGTLRAPVTHWSRPRATRWRTGQGQ